MPRVERHVLRARIVQSLRRVLDDAGFVEVHTPLLSAGGCPDVALDSFAVPDGGYLVTSTEYHLKRLAAEGLDRAYTLGPNFRRGELGPRHNPEFVMLEWYRTGATLEAIEHDALALVRAAYGAVSRSVPEAKRLSVQTAIEQFSGVDVGPDFAPEAVARAVTSAGLDLSPALASDPLAQLSVLVSGAQTLLGFDAPTFVVDWPSQMTTSARPHPSRPALALRSELVIEGVEVADGFPFLTDAALQEALFVRELREREKRSLPPVGIDAHYLRALRSGLPEGAGMALGVDRLVMLALGHSTLSDVQAFSWQGR